MLRLIFIAALLLTTSFLTSCGVLSQTPPDQAVKLAIAQTLTNTQQTLAQDLNLSAAKPNFKIKKIAVKSREKVNGPSFKQYPGEVYRVRGTFDTALSSPSNASEVKSNNPFEIYLSTETTDTDSVETWYLIHPGSPTP